MNDDKFTWKDWGLVLMGSLIIIVDAELMYRLKWTRVKYEAVRDQLLGEPDPVLIHTPSGGLAVTW